MKRTLLTLLSIALPVVFLSAQSRSFTSFAEMNDSLIARFNRDDFKSIYSLESLELRKTDPEDGFINYLSQLKKQSGPIVATSQTGAYGISREFKWAGQHKNFRVELYSKVPGRLDDYYFSDLTEQPDLINKPLSTDNPLKSRIDSVVNQMAAYYMQDANTVALSIGVYNNGEKHAYNYGEIKKDSGKLPAGNNFYNLGSIAKTFVATMLAQAVIEKKASLNDDIRKYLPGWYPNLQYQGYPVRLVHLINHTSALPEDPRPLPANLRQLSPLDRSIVWERYTQDSLLEDLHHLKPDTIPGTRYQYSANGFHIAMVILERIYHKPFEQLITGYLKTHLGMYNTKNFFSPAEMKLFLQGYDNNKEPQFYHYAKTTFRGGPSMNSTINDMLKYVEENLKENDPAVKLTHQYTWGSKDGFAMGLGWMENTDTKGERYFFHGGHSGWGFNALCIFNRTRNTGIVILVNENTGQDRVSALERLILHRVTDN